MKSEISDKTKLTIRDEGKKALARSIEEGLILNVVRFDAIIDGKIIGPIPFKRRTTEDIATMVFTLDIPVDSSVSYVRLWAYPELTEVQLQSWWDSFFIFDKPPVKKVKEEPFVFAEVDATTNPYKRTLENDIEIRITL